MPVTNVAESVYSGGDVQIGEILDFDLYERRRLHLYPRGEPAAPLPESFPAQATSAAAWSRQDIAMQDLIVSMSREDMEDVETTLARLRGA
jgi:hypothetical protein